MKLYTSYFARLRLISKNENLVPLSIASLTPHWASELERLPMVMPPKELVLSYKAGDTTEEEYEEYYTKEILDKMDLALFTEKILEITDMDRTPVLLCYETSDSFCHRHILTKWLRKHGFVCSELEF